MVEMQSPESVSKLVEAGLKVLVESGAGEEAKFRDSDYMLAGAAIVDRQSK